MILESMTDCLKEGGRQCQDQLCPEGYPGRVCIFIFLSFDLLCFGCSELTRFSVRCFHDVSSMLSTSHVERMLSGVFQRIVVVLYTLVL